MSSSPHDQPVDLVIRFTAAIPDAVIRVPSAKLTTPLALRQQIRAQLPASFASNRLRLISAGKVLPDATALSKCINIPPPPPRSKIDSAASKDKNKNKNKAKGKAPAETTVPRVYIHCSIGDTLTPGDIASEADAAEAADKALLLDVQAVPAPDQTQNPTTTSSTPAPRGFDRLLSAGFSPADVANLRAQFMAIQAHTHTPDTMPTGDDLRSLEERWLENDPANAAAGGGAGTDEEGGLEDMLWGNLMGFFWPIAAACWLMREEGVWTRRMQISVLSGLLVNLTFGFLRITS
ncbi:hypothetical protein D6C84_03468 [Aureobasidium pullulans]|uniref:Ubiquitin-like domain-containing protein n=2 Tax=Aureobasidium pullulans TaxID=5580 RepID=A0A074XEA9_AURPU|nr:uncharacterized protein M438DRAFT_374762 [Aureobasidium pullulans EXF-150]THW17665.1 hypothetical protein D6D24_03778 [Aureobasidium pullulans]KEQ83733.1 hypothetical protein M438DRAFT_374762 [Aureobasidium pullulans EXF-150]THW41426.1 hypothetical protein D6D22_05421 [Aureobasidium pullulans]THW73268.1 hypothetical protein D6D19_05805 [Aureobasidium pullulans]THX13540.1 hypothetical protein D6D18_00128 [Aureobasidium pullulans]